MVTRFLLLGCLAVARSGCGPAAVLSATLPAAPFASALVVASRVGDPLLALASGLKAAHPQERKRALKLLVAEGSPAAWRLVFSALADGESQVADEAQLSLARLPSTALAAELAGRAGLAHRELPVRLRAVEALGRVGLSLDVALLLSALDDREPEVAHLALWSLERLANQQHLSGDFGRAGSLIERAARTHRDGGVRAAAVCARAAIAAVAAREQARAQSEASDGSAGTAHAGPTTSPLADIVELLARCREDRDGRVRCAAAMAARVLPAAQALSLTSALARDPHEPVRLAMIETCEALACRAGVMALIASFEHEEQPRARAELTLALQRLSGLKHRDDPRPWRDWAQALPLDWQPTLLPQGQTVSGRLNGAAAAAGGEARTSARTNFVGLPMTSLRVCFAIDFSGSMWTPMADGRIPKELVDSQLRATLETLPSETWFNIVVFTNDVLPWRPKLVMANPNNVRTAIADFERCQAHGRGNFFDAALFALEDPSVDTLLTLTDGVPTGGFHSHLDLVIPLLLERNRFRRVAFDTVLVDAPPGSERRWRVLSQESGGRVVSTEQGQ